MNTIFKNATAPSTVESLGDGSKLLSEVIYQRLRLDILNGALERGQILRQEEIAQRLSVSRVPLREAMSRLEAEGLLVLRPRRGYAVTSLDQAAIVEIFELRMVVEEHAGSIAALARTTHDVDEVAAIIDYMESLNPDAENHFSEWCRCNREFHGRIIASSRRSRVIRLAGTLHDTVEPYIRAEAEYRRVGHVRDADNEHREMFNAFRAGDSRGLGTLCRTHIENVAQRLLKSLRRNAASGGKPRLATNRQPDG
jgi:DNA-binding GntR family transcriptional regulator